MRRARLYLTLIAADPELEAAPPGREVAADSAAPAVRDCVTGSVLPAPVPPPPGAGPGRRDAAGRGARELPAQLLAATS